MHLSAVLKTVIILALSVVSALALPTAESNNLAARNTGYSDSQLDARGDRALQARYEGPPLPPGGAAQAAQPPGAAKPSGAAPALQV